MPIEQNNGSTPEQQQSLAERLAKEGLVVNTDFSGKPVSIADALRAAEQQPPAEPRVVQFVLPVKP